MTATTTSFPPPQSSLPSGLVAAGLETAAAEKHSLLTEQAQKWVGQTFFGTMLRQMRESPFKSDLFSGGRGGQAFAEMHDQHLAERMARGAGRSLATSIVRHIERRGRASATESSTKRTSHVASTR
jgi:Rod binding domain-containing protein